MADNKDIIILYVNGSPDNDSTADDQSGSDQSANDQSGNHDETCTCGNHGMLQLQDDSGHVTELHVSKLVDFMNASNIIDSIPSDGLTQDKLDMLSRVDKHVVEDVIAKSIPSSGILLEDLYKIYKATDIKPDMKMIMASTISKFVRTAMENPRALKLIEGFVDHVETIVAPLCELAGYTLTQFMRSIHAMLSISLENYARSLRYTISNGNIQDVDMKVNFDISYYYTVYKRMRKAFRPIEKYPIYKFNRTNEFNLIAREIYITLIDLLTGDVYNRHKKTDSKLARDIINEVDDELISELLRIYVEEYKADAEMNPISDERNKTLSAVYKAFCFVSDSILESSGLNGIYNTMISSQSPIASSSTSSTSSSTSSSTLSSSTSFSSTSSSSSSSTSSSTSN